MWFRKNQDSDSSFINPPEKPECPKLSLTPSQPGNEIAIVACG